MKSFLRRLVRLILGLFLFGAGIVCVLNAQIGYAPWEVFHAGLSKVTGLSIGIITIIAGVVFVFASMLLGEKIGIGTIFNMVLVGVFIDLLMGLNIIPMASGIFTGIVLLLIGLFIIALATYFYISAAFGAGPRDGLMVALKRKTKLPIGVCRGAIELTVLVCGWLLGGMVGLGTVISVAGVGAAIQLVFRLFKFDAAGIEHETIDQTYKFLLSKLK